MATVADLVVQRLRGAGVRALFGVPGGGGNLDLIAAAGRAGLPFVLTSTETAGAIAALAQAEITGAPGACLTTLGPGATSVANGVACAFLERAPLVVFTDAQSVSSGAFAHQRIDHRALLAPVTKSSETLTADNALQAIASALHAATDARPGPVHLDCPGDVAGADTATTGAARLLSGRPLPTPQDGRRLDAILAASRKPLLLAGVGARDRMAAFCERHRVPAMVTYKAKGVVPDDHAWFGGVFTNAALEQPLIDESDLLIGIGLDPVELIPRAWKRPQPVVYFGPWPVEDGHVPFECQVVDGFEANLARLDGSLGRTAWDPSVVACHVQQQRHKVMRRTDEGFTAQRVIDVAARMLSPVAARVTVDAGAHMFPATVMWPATEPRRMLISNGLSTMGFALPAAVGAALLDRNEPIVALTGDGGLLMCLGELATAAREGLRIVTIVFNDASLSLIEIKQQARQLPAAGVALGGIDWQAIARGFGVRAWRSSNPAELERAIAAALDHSGPSLIEATIDRTNYGATMRAVRG